MPRPTAPRETLAAIVARQAATIDAANDAAAREPPTAKLEATRRACRAALAALRIRPDRDAVLSYRDPLPESTLRALARLRRSAGRGGAGS